MSEKIEWLGIPTNRESPIGYVIANCATCGHALSGDTRGGSILLAKPNQVFYCDKCGAPRQAATKLNCP